MYSHALFVQLYTPYSTAQYSILSNHPPLLRVNEEASCPHYLNQYQCWNFVCCREAKLLFSTLFLALGCLANSVSHVTWDAAGCGA